MKLPSTIAAAVSIAAQRHALEPAVLAALVMQESGGDSNAIRFEPHYRYLWDCSEWKPFRRLTAEEVGRFAPPLDFHAQPGESVATEWASQRVSWGACQVMGAVARERGFKGTFLSQLCEPSIGIEYGAIHLSLLLATYELPDALSAYNAGRPTPDNEAKYVRPVLRMAADFRKDGF